MSDFHPIAGESFNGAIARWAPDNGAERMIDVTRAAGVVHAHRQTAGRAERDRVAAIADEMGVEVDALVALSTPLDGPDLGNHSRRLLNGVSVPTSLLEARRRRIAPAAFAPAAPADPPTPPPHHRALWDFRLLPACTETWQYLVDRCGHEGCSDLGWHHTPGIELCEHCMRDLADTPAESVEDAFRADLRNVAGLVHHDPTRRAEALALLPPAISGLGAAVTVDLIYRLLPVVTPGVPRAPHSPATADPNVLAATVCAAWRIVADWPGGALAHIGGRVSNRATRHSDGNRGETMRFLEMNRLIGLRPEVHDLAASLRDELDIKGPHAATLRRATRTSNEGARMLRIGTQIVADFRRRGVLATIPVLAHGCLQPRLSAMEVDLVLDGVGRRIGVEALQKRLGISHHGVEQLEALGIVHMLNHPYFEARYAVRQADKASVVALEADLAAASVRDDPERFSLPLVDAMKAVGARRKPWGPVIDGMRDGRIPMRMVAGDAPLSRRLLTDPLALHLITDEAFVAPTGWARPFAPLVTKVDAIETLNLSPKQATPLLRVFPTVKGSHERSVPVDKLLELAELHISSVELAARRGVDPSAAYYQGRGDRVPWLGPAGFCRVTAEKTYFADCGQRRASTTNGPVR